MRPEWIGPGAAEVMPDWAQKEERLALHLPYVALLADDMTIRTRGNEFIRCLRVSGVNSFTHDDELLDRVKAVFATVVAQSGDGFSFYVHKVSRRIDTAMPEIPGDDFAAEIDRRWQAHLAGAALRDRTLTITVVKRPTRGAGIPLIGKIARKALDGQVEGQLRMLDEVMSFLKSSLDGLMPAHVLTGSSGELLGFLESINTGIEIPTFPRGGPVEIVADSVANARVTFRGNRFHVTGGALPDRVGTIFGIKTYPASTYVTMFDELALPLDMVVTHSFTPVNSNLMGERIKRAIRQMRSTADAAESLAQELRVAGDDLASQRLIFGDHHMTVSVFTDRAETLEPIAAEIRNIAAAAGVKMVSEGYSTRAMYFAQHPGNSAYRVREAAVTNINLADMAALHRTPMGKEGGSVPWGTPITTFPTPERSAFRFSFHEKGSPGGEPTAGHTLVLGRSGSGKSVVAGFLLAQARRAGARIFAFDYRAGMEMAIRALGGRYSTIRAGEPTGLNPLWVETDPAGREWLTDWLVQLFETDATPLNPHQANAIQAAVRQNAEVLDPALRNWSSFAELLASHDDNGDVQARAGEWTAQGRYGWIFGQGLEDNFSLDGDVVGFDLTGILDSENEKSRMAVLSYIFRRIERKIADKTPTIVLIDEAWKAFDNEYFAGRLEDWLVTARKQNTVVVMLTQFASQLEKTRTGQTIIQAVPTQVLLPNVRAKREDYALLGLHEKELEILTGATPASHLALVRDDQGSVVVDADLSPLGGLLKILGGLKTGEALVGEDYRNRPDFWKGH